MIWLGLLALGLGGLGACFVLVGTSVGDSFVSLPVLLIGGGALYLAFLCVRRLRNALRTRRDRP